MVNKVEICGVNTAKLPLYKEAEMMQMIKKIQAGDKPVSYTHLEKILQGKKNGMLVLVITTLLYLSLIHI